jgi:hypothetical protein
VSELVSELVLVLVLALASASASNPAQDFRAELWVPAPQALLEAKIPQVVSFQAFQEAARSREHGFEIERNTTRYECKRS